MDLYTVTIDFEDRTKAIEQVECSNEVEALHAALRDAEALESYESRAIEETIKDYLRVIHVGKGFKGVWLWHHCNFDNQKVEDIYGGSIVQTDRNGAARHRSS
ncbi:MAG: hypothetical protein HUJ18_07320 [Marinobacter sp.]|nr:hypothetical protein [Marinobacter sp.]